MITCAYFRKKRVKKVVIISPHIIHELLMSAWKTCGSLRKARSTFSRSMISFRCGIKVTASITETFEEEKETDLEDVVRIKN